MLVIKNILQASMVPARAAPYCLSTGRQQSCHARTGSSNCGVIWVCPSVCTMVFAMSVYVTTQRSGQTPRAYKELLTRGDCRRQRPVQLHRPLDSCLYIPPCKYFDGRPRAEPSAKTILRFQRGTLAVSFEPRSSITVEFLGSKFPAAASAL